MSTAVEWVVLPFSFQLGAHSARLFVRTCTPAPTITLNGQVIAWLKDASKKVAPQPSLERDRRGFDLQLRQTGWSGSEEPKYPRKGREAQQGGNGAEPGRVLVGTSTALHKIRWSAVFMQCSTCFSLFLIFHGSSETGRPRVQT